jgi:hypothetical protein
MASESPLQKAYAQHQLWPSIHSAVDVYLKRKRAKAEPFELVWRLIHIWESSVITLAEAGTSRLISLDRPKELRKIRELLYGRNWNEVEGVLEVSRNGALNGSIDRWIEILSFISTLEVADSPFLTALRDFLAEEKAIDLRPLVAEWSRACEVPMAVRNEEVPVRVALRSINQFRNRFAHIPFPHDLIGAVCAALESCTENLFSAEPSPLRPNGVLAGVLAFGGSLIKGQTSYDSQFGLAVPSFIFGIENLAGGKAKETWDARPFIYVDQMLRPYVMTRILNEEGDWEFTRYMAEWNAVVVQREPAHFDRLPIPSEPEYHTISSEVGAHQDDASTVEDQFTVSSLQDAVFALRQRNFKPALSYLEDVIHGRPSYHVAWLRLGTGRRELAVDLSGTEATEEELRALLDSSLEALEHAKGHSDLNYRAEAHYQASKTLYRIWRQFQDRTALDKALKEADDAANIIPEDRFLSWIEYLEREDAENQAHQ